METEKWSKRSDKIKMKGDGRENAKDKKLNHPK